MNSTTTRDLRFEYHLRHNFLWSSESTARPMAPPPPPPPPPPRSPTHGGSNLLNQPKVVRQGLQKLRSRKNLGGVENL